MPNDPPNENRGMNGDPAGIPPEEPTDQLRQNGGRKRVSLTSATAGNFIPDPNQNVIRI